MDAGITICPFAIVAGIACPGCGMTRALLALGRGDVELAFLYHPLVFAVIALAIGWVFLRRRVMPSSPWFTWAAAGLFAVTWVIRLTTGTLPPV